MSNPAVAPIGSPHPTRVPVRPVVHAMAGASIALLAVDLALAGFAGAGGTGGVLCCGLASSFVAATVTRTVRNLSTSR